jgi:hypothetical protein
MLKKGQVDDMVLIIIAAILIIIGSVFFAVLSHTHSDKLNQDKQVFLETGEGVIDIQLLTIDLLTILDININEEYTLQQLILEAENAQRSGDNLKKEQLSEYFYFDSDLVECKPELNIFLKSVFLHSYTDWTIEIYDDSEKIMFCGEDASEYSSKIKIPSKDPLKTLEVVLLVE